VKINFVELESFRQEMGWSKKDLAYEIGCDYTLLWRLQAGKSMPGNQAIAGLIRLANGSLRFLKVS
jgi:ribosome-binding protein aMBF1 (putative translation factor)